MFNTDLTILIFWSFTVITIVLSVGVMCEGTVRILFNPRIIRNIVRLIKLAITKINKSIKKILNCPTISNNSRVRPLVFTEITPVKTHTHIHTQSRIYYNAH
jgi:hypothetical protein